MVPGPLRQVRRQALAVVLEGRLPGGEHDENQEEPDQRARDADRAKPERLPRAAEAKPALTGRRLILPRLLSRECRATRPLTRRLVTLLVEPLRVLVPAHVSLRARVLVAAGAAVVFAVAVLAVVAVVAVLAVLAVVAARVAIPLVSGTGALVVERLR